MKSQIIATILIIFLEGVSYSSCKLLVIESENVEYLKSSVVNYPLNDETFDVIWLFPHSIRLNIKDFHLNGHDGDFLLISEYPMINEEIFKDDAVNGTDINYATQLARSIITDQGLLLSWKIEEKQVEVLNPDGTFVLFHTEGKAGSPPQSQFTGFEIEVRDYDSLRTTTTSTTPDPYISPLPGQEIYISKFLSCTPPKEFLKERDNFKTQIAALATAYCEDEEITLEKGDFLPTEVNIPDSSSSNKDRAGIHYCNSNWDIYEQCVEVTFAITRLDESGSYILRRDLLEDMWSKKSTELQGFCPYDPKKEVDGLSALTWIGFFCGIGLILICLLGICVLTRTNTKSILDYKIPFTKDITPGKKRNAEINERPQLKVFDSDNPILGFISSGGPSNNNVYHQTPKEDLLYPSGNSSLFQINHNFEDEEEDDNTPLGFKKHSYTKNPSFQDTEDARKPYYDNPDFEFEENVDGNDNNDMAIKHSYLASS